MPEHNDTGRWLMVLAITLSFVMGVVLAYLDGEAGINFLPYAFGATLAYLGMPGIITLIVYAVFKIFGRTINWQALFFVLWCIVVMAVIAGRVL